MDDPPTSTDSSKYEITPTEHIPAPLTLDALEFWVGDISRTRDMLVTAFGLRMAEVPEISGPDEVTATLSVGDLRIVLRQGATASSLVAQHVRAHGDTIADVVLRCTNVDEIV